MQTQNRGQVIFGALLVLLGLMFLISTVFEINLATICWPVFLVGLGVWLLVRPNLTRDGRPVTVKLIGDVRRRGVWPVVPEEMWIGIGDIDLNFVQTNFPAGETHYRVYSLIGDVNLVIPTDTGLSVQATAVIGDARLLGYRETGILAPIDYTSPGYETEPHRIRVELISLIGDIKADRFEPPAPKFGEQIPA